MINKQMNKLDNHHPVGVRVKLSSNRTTIMAGRASLAHISMKQCVKGTHCPESKFKI